MERDILTRAWEIQPHRDIDQERAANGVISISSKTSNYFYVPFGRRDTSFRNRPEDSSFDFSTHHVYQISADLVTSGEIQAQLALVEYFDGGDRVIMGEGDYLDYHPNNDAKAVTVALRVKGIGEIQLGHLSVKSFESIPIEDISRKIDVFKSGTVRLTLNAFSKPGNVNDAALLLLSFQDRLNEPMIPLADQSVHPTLGSYSYVKCGTPEYPDVTQIEMTVPNGAHSLTISGMPWKRSAEVYASGQPAVEILPAISEPHEDDMASFMRSIPVEDSLIVLYTTAPPLGHPTLSLRPNRLAKEYLEQGCWVVFFPFSRVGPGAEVVGERCRQYSLSDLHRFLDLAYLRRGKNNVFICSSFPNLAAVTTIDLLKANDWQTVYEVRDDMEEFNRVGYSKWFHPQLESRVASSVDQVIAVSPRLTEKMKIIGNAKNAVTVPNAVDGNLIEMASHLRSASAYSQKAALPVVGYIGHLTPSWFDWNLVLFAAESPPDVRFEIIGHGAPSELEMPSNMVLHGPKTHNEFIEICQSWKVGLIPFKSSTLTAAVDPNKIYEYLAAGLRVVTAPMGSVAECPSTWIYRTGAEFEAAIQDALLQPYTPEEFEQIESFLRESTWKQRAAQMLRLMKVINE